jgi:hypothetical protein
MQDDTQIKQFFKLLKDSGLDPERQMFWLNKIADGNFNEDDEKEFLRELREHLDDLDGAIAETDMEIEEHKLEEAKMEKEALPYLSQLSAKQQQFYDEQNGEYKNVVLTAEKNMMNKIEKIRGNKTSSEIDAIRKMLKSK